MKPFIPLFRSLLVVLLTTLSLNASAEWYNTFTFLVGDGVCTPITVRYSGRTYKVYSSQTITFKGSTSTPSATDCNGNSLKYEASYETKTRGSDTYHYNTYTFYNKQTYGSSRNQNNNSYNSNSEGYNSGYDYGATGAAIGHALADTNIKRAFDEGGAYPGLHANIGMSNGYGEYVRLRVAARGFQVYAGVGKDWFFNGENKKKLLWHAGLGGYYSLGPDRSRWGDVAFGLTVAENAMVKNLSLTFDFDFTYWIGRWKRVGVFAGGGLGWGDIKDLGKRGHHSKFAWNLECGVSFRLCTF